MPAAGKFIHVGPGVKVLECKEGGQAITHSDPKPKAQVQAVWQNPKAYSVGRVYFRYTVAVDYKNHWTAPTYYVY